MNYNKIEELFGAPLNQVPRPSTPYQFKTWHAVAGIIIVVLVYKGGQKIYEDYFKVKNQLLIPLKLKDDKQV
jgi:hypothetical protein